MSYSKSMQQFLDCLSKINIQEMPHALRAVIGAAEKSVTIEVADKDLEFLKKNGYGMCIAKRTKEESYNVIWSSYSEYLSNNNFSWTPLYELFGTNTFQDDVTVTVATNQMAIGLGETSVLDSSGLLQDPTTGGPAESITMKNEFHAIHPGLSQLLIAPDGSRTSAPFYVAEDQIAKGSVVLTPVEKVQVWFEQNVQTGTMFSTARSNVVEIDLTNSNSESRTYQGGEWVKE